MTSEEHLEPLDALWEVCQGRRASRREDCLNGNECVSVHETRVIVERQRIESNVC